MTDMIYNSLLADPKNGGFISSCMYHCGMMNWIVIGNDTILTHFDKWYNGES